MNLVDDDLCPMCLSDVETVEHLFFECPFSSQCLRELGNWLQLTTTPQKLLDMIKYKWK